jgi:transcriptional regulator with XRE-family HTH domain
MNYVLTILTVKVVSRHHDPAREHPVAESTRTRRSSAAAAEPTKPIQPTVSVVPPAPAPVHTSIERSVNAIGPRVREQRRIHGYSLQQTAVLAGVSAASIHKVERGDMVPTITTLLKLASAFGLPLSSFVDDTVDGHAGVGLVRADDRRRLTSSWPGTDRAVITSGTPPFRLDGEVLEVAAGGSGELSPDGHCAERLCFVVDGTLEMSAGGERSKLRAGDTLQIVGNRSVSWHNSGRRVARIVLVSAPADQS